MSSLLATNVCMRSATRAVQQENISIALIWMMIHSDTSTPFPYIKITKVDEAESLCDDAIRNDKPILKATSLLDRPDSEARRICT